MEKGYVILVGSKLKKDETTVLLNLNKKLVYWVDEQVQAGKYRDRSHLIGRAVSQYKE